jgi:hypothetical protein
MRDTVFLRFPKENETYFNDGKAFFQASPRHTPFNYEDVEFPEDRTTIKGTSSEPQDETAQELGATKEESEGTENEPELMWSIKTNTLMRSVYHGLPAWEYSRLIEYGRWNSVNSRRRGELSGVSAVYFATAKEFALFFGVFKSAISTDGLLEKLSGVVIETPLPPCKYALVFADHREEFAVINRKKAATAPIPPTPVVVSGYLKRWVKMYANRSDLGPIVQWSHQLAVIDWENGPMKSMINLNPSYIAIINPKALDFEKKEAI